MLRISGTGATDVGLVRDNNEDSAFVGASCMLVADGVGGGAAGEIASATAAYVVSATALARPDDDPVAVLSEAVLKAQEEIARGVLQDPDRAGMATTLTAVFTDGHTIGLAHVGDSRGYVFRGGALTRVTRDHTYVQDLVDAGLLDEIEVAEHPRRNVVTRSVHGNPVEEADITVLPLAPSDRVLLVTDGVSDLVSEQWLEEILANHEDDAAAAAIVAAALSQGGRDNITCVLGTLIDGPAVSGDGRLLGAVLDPVNIVDATAVRPARTA